MSESLLANKLKEAVKKTEATAALEHAEAAGRQASAAKDLFILPRAAAALSDSVAVRTPLFQLHLPKAVAKTL